MELDYKDFSPLAKKGINKFGKLSSKKMIAYNKMYEDETGKSAANANNKVSFYSFVAKNRLKKKYLGDN